MQRNYNHQKLFVFYYILPGFNRSFFLECDSAKGKDKDSTQAYAWYATAYSNGLIDAKKPLDDIARKLNDKEIEQAKKLASEFIKKYPAPSEENHTYKSNTECQYP
ncbi:hypothetical protein [Buttiauxella sp.]|uniref:hypothetical protein n=1 Tax=Buttiauxella sp. TaxID=1972222 RepID=UPI003C781711